MGQSQEKLGEMNFGVAFACCGLSHSVVLYTLLFSLQQGINEIMMRAGELKNEMELWKYNRMK